MSRGKYNASPITINDAQWGDLQLDANGYLKTSSSGAAVTPGTGATNLGKAEDAVHTTGDVGTFSLGVATDGVTALAAAGDYSVMGTDIAGNMRTVNNSFSASATFTPAATSHVAGDCHGAAAQFSFGAMSGSRIKILSVTMEIDGATIETTAWTLYLYSVTPPSAIADDGAWDLPSGDRASFLGKVDIAQVVDLGSTLWIETHGINKPIKLAGTSVFGYLVNGTTLTPQNVAHIVTLHAVTV
jgi:hypothetical protein